MTTDPSKKPTDPFALFVRAKEGHVVRRFGTPGNIGHTFTPGQGTIDPTGERREKSSSAQTWDTETIHALTQAELDQHGREYEAELQPDGGLVRCTREAWEKQRAEAKAKREADKKAEAAAKRSATPAESAGS